MRSECTRCDAKMNDDILMNGVILLHPVRYKIIGALKEAGRSMYIDEVANEIEENPRLVSFHLSTLEEKGFATSKFDVIKKPSSKGKAGRFFSLTPKVDTVLEEMTKILRET